MSYHNAKIASISSPSKFDIVTSSKFSTSENMKGIGLNGTMSSLVHEVCVEFSTLAKTLCKYSKRKLRRETADSLRSRKSLLPQLSFSLSRVLRFIHRVLVR